MEDRVASLVQMFEEAEDATREARKLAERDRDYYDGKQWTADETSALEKRKQPVVTYNRIQRKVDYLSGLEKQQRKDPKGFPRTPKDEKAADAATDAIRYVCDDTRSKSLGALDTSPRRKPRGRSATDTINARAKGALDGRRRSSAPDCLRKVFGTQHPRSSALIWQALGLRGPSRPCRRLRLCRHCFYRRGFRRIRGWRSPL
jgi:hypothetical protein